MKRKKVKVRIGLVVNDRGDWCAVGQPDIEDDLLVGGAYEYSGIYGVQEGQVSAEYILTAEVELPYVVEVKAKVERRKSK